MLLVNEKAMTNHVYLGFQVAFAAGLFHICCEIVGVNGWYCENRHQGRRNNERCIKDVASIYGNYKDFPVGLALWSGSV